VGNVKFVFVFLVACLLILLPRAPMGRRAKMAVGLFLTAVFIMPVYLAGAASPVAHVGQAPYQLGLATFTIAVVFGLASRLGCFGAALPFVPITLYLVLGLALWWDGSSPQLSGVTLMLVGFGAWVFGGHFGGMVILGSVSPRWVCRILLFLTVFECVVCVVQVAGMQLSILGQPLFQTSRETAELVVGRVNGTTDHPGTLGKLVFFVTLMALPFTSWGDKRVRALAITTIAISFLPLALSQGRANFAAVVSMLVVWLLIAPKTVSLGRRLLLVLLVCAGLVASLSLLFARFAADPGGGAREHLSRVALEGIPRHIWVGVGPNSYVEQFGRFDDLTSEGWPVHNVFLLLIAEVGVVGLVLFVAPVVWSLVSPSLRPGLAPGSLAFARALIASLPGLYVITTTGWGALAGATFVFGMFVLGFVSTGAKTSITQSIQAPDLGRETHALPRTRATRPDEVVCVPMSGAAGHRAAGAPRALG
jgi:hypothetical protein